MEREIQVVGVANTHPDNRLYVLALIALARKLQEEEDRNKDRGRASEPGLEPGGRS